MSSPASSSSAAEQLFSPTRRLQVFSHYYETPDNLTRNNPVPVNVTCFPASVDFFLVPNPALIKGLIRDALDTKGNGLINSDQGGVMFFGVDAAGFVQGFQLIDEEQKDFIRDVVANFLGRFDPVVDKNLYKVSFIPVKDGSVETPNFVVLEILLKTPVVPTLFQMTTGSVFLKAPDGKLEGPLKLSRIQAIIKERYVKQLFDDYDRQKLENNQTPVQQLAVEPAPPEKITPGNFTNRDTGDEDGDEKETATGCGNVKVVVCGCFGKKNKNKKNEPIKTPSNIVSQSSSVKTSRSASSEQF